MPIANRAKPRNKINDFMTYQEQEVVKVKDVIASNPYMSNMESGNQVSTQFQSVQLNKSMNLENRFSMSRPTMNSVNLKNPLTMNPSALGSSLTASRV